MPIETSASDGHRFPDVYVNTTRQLSPDNILHQTDVHTKEPVTSPNNTFVFVKPNMALLRIPSYCYALFSIYIAFMLTWNRRRKLQSSRKACREEEKNNFGKTLIFCRVFAAYFSSGYFLYSSISFWVEGLPGINCTLLGKSENLLYWLNISAIYVVLWLRQRSIYGKSTLKHLTTKVTSFLSNAVGAMVVLLPIVNSTLFMTATVWHKMYGICFIENLRFLPGEVLTSSEFIVPVVLPSTLLGLFVWPLLRHHLTTGKDFEGSNSVIPTIRKTAILTFCCLVTDMAAMTCNLTIYIFYSFIMRQTSVFTNLFFLNLAFSDWRTVMFPCFRTKSSGKWKKHVRSSWSEAAMGVWSTTVVENESQSSSFLGERNIRYYQNEHAAN